MKEVPGQGSSSSSSARQDTYSKDSKSIKDCPTIQTKLEEAKMIITYKVWSSVALQAGGDTLSSKVSRVSLILSETCLVSVTFRLASSLRGAMVHQN